MADHGDHQVVTQPASPYDADALAARFDLRALPDAFFEDPYPLYHALRERAPVYRAPDGSVALSRYADCLAVYRDHARCSSDKRVEFEPKFGHGPLFEHHTTSLVFRDPPAHTRVRRLLQPFFSAGALRAMEPRVTAIVDTALARLAEAGEIDLVSEFAFILPAEVVCDLLGVPAEDRATLRRWAQRILGALEPAISAEQLAAGNAAVDEFCSYLRELVTSKRRSASGDHDVLATLIAATEDSTPLDETELLHNCIFMLNAGHETTTNLIANAVSALLDRPGLARQLRQRPALGGSAVEEFLRFESSNQLGNRRLLAPLDIGGESLPAGTLVTLLIGAANRDPAQFAEPDELRLERTPNRHLAFAAGIHTCAGAALARLEARVAITRLFTRFPALARRSATRRDRRARFRVVRSLRVGI